MTNSNLPAYLAGIGASCIFGFSFFMTKEAIQRVDPIHFIALRFTVAALAMTALTLSGLIKTNIKLRKIKPLLGVAVFQPVLYFMFETFGIMITSSAEAGLFIALIPIAVTVFSALILKEYTTRLQLLFICISITGVIVIILMQSRVTLGENIVGYLLLLGAVFSAAFYTILSRRSSAIFSPVEITFVMMWAGAIIFSAIAIIQHLASGNIKTYFSPLANGEVALAVLYLSLLSSILAFLFINFSLSRLPAFQTTVFANLTTVIAIFAGVFLRNEPFFWFHVFGAVLIIAGVWGTNYFTRQYKKHSKTTSQLTPEKTI